MRSGLASLAQTTPEAVALLSRGVDFSRRRGVLQYRLEARQVREGKISNEAPSGDAVLRKRLGSTPTSSSTREAPRPRRGHWQAGARLAGRSSRRGRGQAEAVPAELRGRGQAGTSLRASLRLGRTAPPAPTSSLAARQELQTRADQELEQLLRLLRP